MPAICGAVELKALLIVVARREAPRRNRSLAFAIKVPVAGDPGRRGAQPRWSDAFTIGKYGLGSAPWGCASCARCASFISAPVVFTYSSRMASARGSVSIGTPNAFATLRPNSVPVYSG
jgi:hypothetical protein